MTNTDYLYDKNAAKDFLGKNYFVDKKLHFRIIERGTIIPHKHMYVNGQWTWGFGGIVDNKNNFVKGSFVGEGGGEVYTPMEEIQHSNLTVVYLGLLYPVWGHAITDNLRRVWFLKSDVINDYFKNCPVVYLPWGGVIYLSTRKILSGCSKLRASMPTDVSRFIIPCSLKISSFPTVLIWVTVSRRNIARRLTS